MGDAANGGVGAGEQWLVQDDLLSLDGKSFVTNSADRIIRCFAVSRVLAGEKAAPRELQDVVNRVQWSHACLASDSEHVIASSASPTEQHLYIWDLHGHLTKTLEGPKDGGIYFVSHPSRPILACCARSGALFVWTKQYAENWSAFAPDFKELEENEEYEEREDEFDIVEVAAGTKAVEEEDEVIDVLTNDVSEVAHVPDADDDEPDLLFLPTKPEPDDDDGADGADAGGGGRRGGEEAQEVISFLYRLNQSLRSLPRGAWPCRRALPAAAWPSACRRRRSPL